MKFFKDKIWKDFMQNVAIGIFASYMSYMFISADRLNMIDNILYYMISTILFVFAICIICCNKPSDDDAYFEDIILNAFASLLGVSVLGLLTYKFVSVKLELQIYFWILLCIFCTVAPFIVIYVRNKRKQNNKQNETKSIQKENEK